MDIVDNYLMLWRVVVGRACNDYLATKFPDTRYTKRWMREMGWARIDRLDDEAVQIRDAFQNGLGVVAEAVGMLHYVEKTLAMDMDLTHARDALNRVMDDREERAKRRCNYARERQEEYRYSQHKRCSCGKPIVNRATRCKRCAKLAYYCIGKSL